MLAKMGITKFVYDYRAEHIPQWDDELTAWYERNRAGKPVPGVIWQSASNDDGATWSVPKELPLALTGDRHLARYAPDGRLVIVFRPVPPRAKVAATTEGLKGVRSSHCTAWVGRYEDLLAGGESDYLVKLLHSHQGADHTYPGLELLPDGTFVATTYIKYREGPELHSVVSVRFKLVQTDAKIAAGKEHVPAPESVPKAAE